MINKYILIVFLLVPIIILIGNNILIDEEMAPYSYTIYSSNKEYCFEMDSDSSGIAYKIENNGFKKKTWSIEGWYAFHSFITKDGQYLIRLGNWPRGQSPSKEDLAIAFYDKGELIKSYSTRELIKYDSMVVVTVSHYMFLKDDPQLFDYVFYLKTIDNILYKFDIRTGEILSSNKNGL